MSRQIHQNSPIADAHGRDHLPTARSSLANGRRNLANCNGPIANDNGPIANGNGPVANVNGPIANGNGPIANGNGPKSKCRLVDIHLSKALESTLWRQRPRHLGEWPRSLPVGFVLFSKGIYNVHGCESSLSPPII